MEKYWLKENVCCEPLISNWYAWTHLVAPTTASANISKRYIQILRSYIEHPDLHINACKDPKLLGGPYINYPKERLEEIQELYNSQMVRNKSLLSLSDAIDQLSSTLEKEATGVSLENIYSTIPNSLSGCVELTYDMQNNANMRFIEPVIYHKYYDSKEQSTLFSVIDVDNRSFVLSTPRFEEINSVLLEMPFADERMDLVYKARREPCELNNIIQSLGITERNIKKFTSLFTKNSPVLMHKKHQGMSLRVRYFGHACILIETSRTSILIDPLISYPTNTGPERYTYFDLPDTIDYVLITHNHQDHIDLETLLQIRYQVKQVIVPRNNNGFLADPSLKLALRHIGFKNVLEMNEFEKIILEDGEITCVPFLGEHGDLNIQSKAAYHININEKSFFFGVDSNNLDTNLYKAISEMITPVHTIFIGMECEGAPCSWTYGPLFSKKIKYEQDQSRRLNGSDCEKAWQIIQTLKCKEVNIYAMGQEPWLRHIMGLAYTDDSLQLKEVKKLLNKCQETGIKAGQPYCKQEWIYE